MNAVFRARWTRSFSTSRSRSNRAVVYTQNGNPAEVLSAMTFPKLDPPRPSTVNVKFLLSPINPADINVVEGVYPAKPQPVQGIWSEDVYIGGNEGLAIVTAIGEGVDSVKPRDWVILTKAQAGTWTAVKNISAEEIVKIPNPEGLSEVHGATMTVNPPTAYNMLNEFVGLKPGDWVIQNGANSAVGQAAIQIAAAQGLKTINFVRNRDDIVDLVQRLEALGANKVFTYDDLKDREFRKKISILTGNMEIRLGLNCVGGPETTQMTKLLGNDAHLVSYGAMSKQPLSFPTSLFIFKNLTAHGFWQHGWYQRRSHLDRENLMRKLVDLTLQGKLKEPEHEIVTVPAYESDEEATMRIRNIFKTAQSYGKKILLKLECSS
ncbi:NAD(P)-binding protein [Guyanagaster necrorhizus]|uniref:enoyl-[acyl-carrier-protein] reductase n=1 Tax=Guyanagaster necrorhizus TaxID=856835 RepID=A0A9P7VNB5_9AGAR|nr:NAD(P)-binding protein [Guyanagaster necrorhizus MCA 3950]KAG7443693.1 NAD(P)-binding protein [Guyanagaster necrorhizus MCA 3950]